MENRDLNIALLTVFHGQRFDVTELFCMRFANLKTRLAQEGIELQCFAGISMDLPLGNEHIALAEKYGVVPIKVVAKNYVGLKWNAAAMGAMQATQYAQVSHVVIVGDDDLLSLSFFRMAKLALRHGVIYMGLRNVTFFDSKSGATFDYFYRPKVNAMYIKTVGAGRIFRSDFFEAIGMRQDGVEKASSKTISGPMGLMWYKEDLGLIKPVNSPYFGLWDDKLLRGLDASADAKIAQTGIMPEPIDMLAKDILLLDFKSSHNIWAFEQLRQQCGTNNITWRYTTDVIAYLYPDELKFVQDKFKVLL